MPGRRMLYGECVNATIMTSDLQPSMTDSNRSYKVNIWKEPFDPDKLLILIFKVEILSGHFYLVELLKPEFA